MIPLPIGYLDLDKAWELSGGDEGWRKELLRFPQDTFLMSVCGYGEEGATLGTKESRFIKEITCVWTLKDGYNLNCFKSRKEKST